jgi:hypothetical protein
MLGALLVLMPFFLIHREPAIDNMPRRKLGRLTFRAAVWEAITAHSHNPAYPSEISVEGKGRKS